MALSVLSPPVPNLCVASGVAVTPEHHASHRNRTDCPAKFGP